MIVGQPEVEEEGRRHRLLDSVLADDAVLIVVQVVGQPESFKFWLLDVASVRIKTLTKTFPMYTR